MELEDNHEKDVLLINEESKGIENNSINYKQSESQSEIAGCYLSTPPDLPKLYNQESDEEKSPSPLVCSPRANENCTDQKTSECTCCERMNKTLALMIDKLQIVIDADSTADVGDEATSKSADTKLENNLQERAAQIRTLTTLLMESRKKKLIEELKVIRGKISEHERTNKEVRNELEEWKHKAQLAEKESMKWKRSLVTHLAKHRSSSQQDKSKYIAEIQKLSPQKLPQNKYDNKELKKKKKLDKNCTVQGNESTKTIQSEESKYENMENSYAVNQSSAKSENERSAMTFTETPQVLAAPLVNDSSTPSGVAEIASKIIEPVRSILEAFRKPRRSSENSQDTIPSTDFTPISVHGFVLEPSPSQLQTTASDEKMEKVYYNTAKTAKDASRCRPSNKSSKESQMRPPSPCEAS
ncbi:unnamed protein product [Thelazia callipaeda]|uniref:SOAR domain-containing protein n=1 Tax=Thelazia callipaeda TaxID=103827 RepID=A0A0N5D4Q2_THECL|nr:unnamed protein product [Thelazia callipaeda]